MAVDKGKIADVGRGRPPAADTVIDASGMTVMPGFVDPHTHLVFAGSRESELRMKLQGKTYMQILRAGGGIMSTVRATRLASIRLLEEIAAFRCELMLRHGTTTCEAKSGYGLDLETELKMLDAIKGIKTPMDIVPTFLGAHALPPEFAKTPDYIEFIIKKVLPRVKGRARFCDVFCEDGAFTLEDSRRLLTAAKKSGLVPKIHADEIKNIGGSSLAAELGAISADHLLATTDKDLTAMAKAGVMGVYLPATPFSLMMKEYPDVRRAIRKGVAVALATDFNPNAWTHSMPFVMNLACYKMGMTPAEAVTASTINAAWAIGMQDKVGSLEVGKQADIAIIGLPSHEHIPYRFGMNPVVCTIKKGKVVWMDPDYGPKVKN